MTHPSIFTRGSVAIQRESPTLLALASVATFISATVMAVRATPKAIDVIEDATYPEDKKDRLFQQAKDLAPIYAPAAAMTMIATGFLYGSTVVSGRRYAALASVAAISERSLQTWQDSVRESVGEKKYSEIKTDILEYQTRDLSAPPANGVGDSVLCFDVISGRYMILPSIESLRGVINALNEQLLAEMFITINDLYFELDMEPVQYGDEIGWSSEGGLLELQYDPIMTKDNRPCVAISFFNNPTHIFARIKNLNR